jgi:hypothetical protein
MPRGRPKRMKEPVSINNESVAVMENNPNTSIIDQLEVPPYNAPTEIDKELELADTRDEQIATLEKKLREFEERFAKRQSGIEPTSPVIYQKAKEKEIPKIIPEVSARDIFEIEDRKPVTGIFRMNNKKPGEKGMIKIGAMRKYKGDKMDPWIFEHGKTYTIPKWLADWLNGGETDPDAKVKSPRCNIVTHNDQDTNLQEKRMLTAPTKHSLFSFSPIAKW